VLFWIINECWQISRVRQLNSAADVAYKAVHVVLAGFAVKPARLAEARVVYQVSDYAFHEVFAVDEN
jgi:hypothetical protein